MIHLVHVWRRRRVSFARQNDDGPPVSSHQTRRERARVRLPIMWIPSTCAGVECGVGRKSAREADGLRGARECATVSGSREASLNERPGGGLASGSGGGSCPSQCVAQTLRDTGGPGDESGHVTCVSHERGDVAVARVSSADGMSYSEVYCMYRARVQGALQVDFLSDEDVMEDVGKPG